ncbi:hypothetical protein JW711_01675 [Candidatus Woesearchaeota archaeon]|nr:hypothetical protein [Candidatus Woesearchaeota archaeon]
MRKKGLSERSWMPILLSVSFIALFLFSIIFIRTGRTGFPYPNGESYYNLRMSEEIYLDVLFSEDTLQGRMYYPNPFHYLAAYARDLLGSEKMKVCLPVLLGVMTAFLFYRLLSMLGFPKKNAIFAMLLLVASPAFVSTFTSLSINSLVITLSFLALVTYFSKSYWDAPWKNAGKVSFAIALVTLTILSLTSIYAFFLTIIFMLLISIFESRSLKTLLISSSIPFLVLIPIFLFTNFISTTLNSFDFQAATLSSLLSILGAKSGFDLFVLILFFTGLIIIWFFIKRIRPYHVAVLLISLASVFSPLLRIYASMAMLVYCVVAIKHLYYRKWELEVVKLGTTFLLVCALVFSSLSYANMIINSEPGPELIGVATQLKSMPFGVLLTEPEYGFLFQEYSGKKTILDGQSMNFKDYALKLYRYDSILNSSRIKDALPFLKESKVSYILITPGMKESLWAGKEEKALFLVRNSERFESLAATDSGFELWYFRPE